MCDICIRKAEHMASLARFFRDAAAESQLPGYREMMIEAATDLDTLRRPYVTCCQCGTEASPSFSRELAFAPELTLPSAPFRCPATAQADALGDRGRMAA